MAQAPKYDMSNAQFGGGFAETVQGDQVGGIINNYGPRDGGDIVRLLNALGAGLFHSELTRCVR